MNMEQSSFDRPKNRVNEVRPHGEILAAKRDQYIQRAIDDVLDNQKDEVLRHNGHDFLLRVQKELISKSALKNQLPRDSRNRENAENEFNISTIERLVKQRFRLRSDASYEAIYSALQSNLRK